MANTVLFEVAALQPIFLGLQNQKHHLNEIWQLINPRFLRTTHHNTLNQSHTTNFPAFVFPVISMKWSIQYLVKQFSINPIKFNKRRQSLFSIYQISSNSLHIHANEIRPSQSKLLALLFFHLYVTDRYRIVWKGRHWHNHLYGWSIQYCLKVSTPTQIQ